MNNSRLNVRCDIVVVFGDVRLIISKNLLDKLYSSHVPGLQPGQIPT